MWACHMEATAASLASGAKLPEYTSALFQYSNTASCCLVWLSHECLLHSY